MPPQGAALADPPPASIKKDARRGLKDGAADPRLITGAPREGYKQREVAAPAFEAGPAPPPPAARPRAPGPRRDSLDPYGAYHTPVLGGAHRGAAHDADRRAMYGHQPTADEPHIVIEYRELYLEIDKERAKALLVKGSVLACRDSDIEEEEEDEATRIRRADEGAAAEAAAQAAITAECASHASEKLVTRLERRELLAAAARARRPGAAVEAYKSLTGFDFALDPVSLDPPNDDSDDDPMDDVLPTMANSRLRYFVRRARCQVPRDYLDLLRQFAAQHPKQCVRRFVWSPDAHPRRCRPMSVERPGGAILQPFDKAFSQGETIVFREYATAGPETLGRAKGLDFDWDRHYAEVLRDAQLLR